MHSPSSLGSKSHSSSPTIDGTILICESATIQLLLTDTSPSFVYFCVQPGLHMFRAGFIVRLVESF